MALDSVVDFGLTTVSTTYDASQTSIVLTTGGGALLPAAPFDGVWWNSTDYSQPALDPNKEIVRVTAKSTDTLTVTRGQRGIAATTKNTAGKTYSFQQSFTKKLYDDILAVTFVGDGTVLSLTPSSALSTGTLPATLISQSANVGLFGPTSGGSTAPTFRAMVNADLGTTLTPQFARAGIGQAADATVPLAILNAGLGVTPTVTLLITNSTAAANNAQQVSGSIAWEGFGWKTTATAASQSVRFQAYVLPVQGASLPSGVFTLSSSINGGAYANALTYTTAGVLTITGGFTSGGSILGPTSALIGIIGRSGIKSSADGLIELFNSTANNFTALNFGGTSSSFHQLRVSGTTLQHRLADNSADGPMSASAGTFSGTITSNGNLTMAAGVLLSITSGTNQRAGDFTLVAGTKTVSNTTVTANTRVYLTRKTSGGTIGMSITYTLSAGTSFTATSDNILDTSVYSYLLIEVP